MPEELNSAELDLLIHRIVGPYVEGWAEESLSEATALLHKLERMATYRELEGAAAEAVGA